MRRGAKISIAAAGSIVLLLSALIAAVFIAGSTVSGRVLIERLTKRLSSGHVRLSGLGGSFPERLTLGELQLSDDRGIWLTAERITVRWRPLDLLRRAVHIDELHAERVDLTRLPVGANGSTSQTSIPHVDVVRATIDVLELAPKLAGSPAALAVRGSVHLRSLDELSADLAAQRIDGDGRYTLRLRFDPKRIEAALRLHEPAGGPLENLLRLPGLGALSAAVSVTGPRTGARIDLAIDAGALRARARGSVNLPARTGIIDFTFDAPATRPRPDLEWQHFAANGHFGGSLLAPNGEGHFEIENLRLGKSTELAALRAHLTAARGLLRIHADIAGLRIPGPKPALLAGEPIDIDASMRLSDPARSIELTAKQRLFELDAKAAIAGSPSVALRLTLPDLAPFAAFAEQDVHGDAVVDVGLNASAAGDELQFKVDGRAALAGGTAAWLHPVGDRAALTLAGSFGPRDIAITRAKLAGRSWSMTAAGEARRPASGFPIRRGDTAHTIGDLIESMQARWTIDVADLGAWSAALAGSVTMWGQIHGSPAAFGGDLRMSSNVAVRGGPRSKVSAALQVQGLPTAATGTLRVSGDLDGAPLALDLALARTRRGQTHAVFRRAEWKSAQLDGDLTLGSSLAQTEGQMRLRVGDLADLQRLLGMEIEGRAEATAAFAPQAGRSHAQLQVTLENVVAGQFAGRLQLSAQGPADALALHVSAQAPDWHGAPAELTAAANLNLAGSELTLTAAALDYRGQTAVVSSPARLSFADGLSIEHLHAEMHNAQLDLNGRVLPALDLRAELHGGTPALIDVFAPGLLGRGKIEAAAVLHGSFAAPLGRLSLDATDLHAVGNAAIGLPAVELHATAELEQGGAMLDARLSAGKNSLVTLGGTAPLRADGELSLKIAGKLDLAIANALLEARGMHAAGVLDVDASVTGRAEAPQIGGTIKLAGGNLRDFVHGVNLTRIDADISGDQGMLDIKSLTARAGTGAIALQGTIGVLQKDIPVDLKITSKDAEPIASNLVTANLNADLRVTGTARGRIEVKGTIHVNRATIGIPTALPPNVAVLDVRRRGRITVDSLGKPLVIAMDVAVDAPRQILVQGRGLDAELGGDLHLGGTTETLRVGGGFDLLRGSFTLAGSRLSFTSGRVSFNGSGLRHKIDPTLDFTAQTTAQGVTTTLRVTGVADAPRFEFTSTPPLGQDEIMARLLFGENAAQLTALQAAQIAAALATLSGVGGNGGLNPLGKLQKALGLDRLTVGAATGTGTGAATGTASAAASGASIAAGRYISKRIYIEAKQNTTGSSQLQVQVDLTKHLKLQTQLGNGTAIAQGTTPENDPGNNVGLVYQFEY